MAHIYEGIYKWKKMELRSTKIKNFLFHTHYVSRVAFMFHSSNNPTQKANFEEKQVTQSQFVSLFFNSPNKGQQDH